MDKVGGTITGPDAYCPLWIPKSGGCEILILFSEFTLIIAYFVTKIHYTKKPIKAAAPRGRCLDSELVPSKHR